VFKITVLSAVLPLNPPMQHICNTAGRIESMHVTTYSHIQTLCEKPVTFHFVAAKQCAKLL